MQLLIIGVGYVGLVIATCLSEIGHIVYCYDIDEQKIEQLGRGEIPFYEPQLQEYVQRNTKEGNLIFTSDLKTAIKKSPVCFICVPTPSHPDGSANVSYVLAAAEEIGKSFENPTIVAIRSTVPVGTNALVKKKIEEILEKRNASIPFDVVSQPEFLREGQAIYDCLHPERIIIGSNSKDAIQVIKAIYSRYADKILVMDPISAELTKYAANSMLAARISFMNELALVCEKIGANIHAVKKGVGLDSRIGPCYLNAGLGFGGSCLPKDVRALKYLFKELGLKGHLVQAIEEVNKQQKQYFLQKIKIAFSSNLCGKTMAIWGISFKPNTDDFREAPSLTIIDTLYKEGVALRLYDPITLKKFKSFAAEYKKLIYCSSEYEAATGSDAVLLLTEWDQFKQIDFEKVLSLMKGNAFFDGRNLFNAQKMQTLGFQYQGIGIPNSLADAETIRHTRKKTKSPC